MARRLLCLHGHFYQPPRENPWIEEIEVQDSAAPFHDWNARVAAECYGPNGASRLKRKDAADRIVDIVNNYQHLSFNFGATLLGWLERHRQDVYASVLEADALSLARRGHGNALAQAYSHPILPLCSPRDLRTQVRWGLADFRRRFHRAAEGFWLPETAADSATLSVLAEEGIRFTVLSPYQAVRVRPPGGGWIDVSGARFDPTRPYRVRALGREIVVFFYDGNIARELAFGGGLASPEALLARIEGGFDGARGHPEILTVAFDGETLGHHKKGADEVLAETLRRMGHKEDLEVVNLSQALERLPVEWEAEIAEGSSWSCAHGIERWRSDCGCQVGGRPGWRQAWRAPLRQALDALRDELQALFEREAEPLLRDPWGARDRFVEVVQDPERREASAFLGAEAARVLEPFEEVKALRLLEMQRQVLLMYASCAWFFADISGLESVQVLKYAARAIQLAREVAGVDLEPAFRDGLARAPSNVPELSDGRKVYERLVEPSVVSLEGVGAHIALASLVEDMPAQGRAFCYRYQIDDRRSAREGPTHLALGRVRVESLLTGDSLDSLFCALHFGASDFRCGLLPFPGLEEHHRLETLLFSERLSLPELLREVDARFTGRDYALRDLFLDERRRVADAILAGTLRRYEADYLRIFEDNRRLMTFLTEIDSPIPEALRVAADVSLTRRVRELTGEALSGEVNFERARGELAATVRLARALGAHREAERAVGNRMAAMVAGRGTAARADQLIAILGLARELGLRLDLWAAQNELWAWTAPPRATLARETLAVLAELLWFDPGTVEARAGYAPRTAAAS